MSRSLLSISEGVWKGVVIYVCAALNLVFNMTWEALAWGLRTVVPVVIWQCGLQTQTLVLIESSDA